MIHPFDTELTPDQRMIAPKVYLDVAASSSRMHTAAIQPWHDATKGVLVAIGIPLAAFVLLFFALGCSFDSNGEWKGEREFDVDVAGADARCRVEVPCSTPAEGGDGGAGDEDADSSSGGDEPEDTSAGESEGPADSSTGGKPWVPYGPCTDDCPLCVVDDGLCTVECTNSLDCPTPPNNAPPYCHEGMCLLACPCPDGAECVEWNGSVSCSWGSTTAESSST